ncbi:MAG: hypothetical protein M3Y55_10375 [Pseudomonadota bacterium]|nr:hypothetical protein [Pseudomonadota bacterium]
MDAALARIKAAAVAEGIEENGYLGQFNNAVIFLLGQTSDSLSEDRVRRAEADAAHEQHLLKMMERAQETAERCEARAKAELDKMQQVARKAEADVKRLELTLETNATQLIERLSAELVAGVKEGSVIRARAYSRGLFAELVAAGVAAVLLILLAGVVIDRTLLAPAQASAPLLTDERAR